MMIIALLATSQICRNAGISRSMERLARGVGRTAFAYRRFLVLNIRRALIGRPFNTPSPRSRRLTPTGTLDEAASGLMPII